MFFPCILYDHLKLQTTVSIFYMTLQDENEHVSVSLSSGLYFFIYDFMCVLQDGQFCKGHRQTQINFIEVAVNVLKLVTIINARNPFHNHKIILEI
jgi:hypothetical protein